MNRQLCCPTPSLIEIKSLYGLGCVEESRISADQLSLPTGKNCPYRPWTWDVPHPPTAYLLRKTDAGQMLSQVILNIGDRTPRSLFA